MSDNRFRHQIEKHSVGRSNRASKRRALEKQKILRLISILSSLNNQECFNQLKKFNAILKLQRVLIKILSTNCKKSFQQIKKKRYQLTLIGYCSPKCQPIKVKAIELDQKELENIEQNQLANEMEQKLLQISVKFSDRSISAPLEKQQTRSLSPHISKTHVNKRELCLETKVIKKIPQSVKNENGKLIGEEVSISRSLTFQYSDLYKNKKIQSLQRKDSINDEFQKTSIKNAKWNFYQSIANASPLSNSDGRDHWEQHMTPIFDEGFKKKEKEYMLLSALKRAKSVPIEFIQKNKRRGSFFSIATQEIRQKKKRLLNQSEQLIFDKELYIKKRESILFDGSQSEDYVKINVWFACLGYFISLILLYFIIIAVV